MSCGEAIAWDNHVAVEVILDDLTAVVMPEDGTVHFAEDLYGHDAKLDRALTRTRLSR